MQRKSGVQRVNRVSELFLVCDVDFVCKVWESLVVHLFNFGFPMPIAIPADPVPVPVVPYFLPPGTSKPRPQWTRFLEDNRAEIHNLLSEKLSDYQLDHLYRTDLDLFFVDHRFNNLRGNIKPAQAAIAYSVDAVSKPSREEIDAIAMPGQPIATALIRIHKLAKAMQVAIAHKHASSITYFELDTGNPFDKACVVPSIYGVEPSKLKDCRRRVGGDDKGFRDFVTASGRRPSPAKVFEAYLEDGGALRGGEFRYVVTRVTATLIFGYLATCAKNNQQDNGGLGFASLEELFCSDPAKFPKVGKFEALSVNAGNLIK
ncbi:hypothetical protein [Bradyrhizobium barranii]